MQKRYGVKELLDVGMFGLALAKYVGENLLDGFQYTDLIGASKLVKPGGDMLEGIQNVPREFGDLDAKEKEFLTKTLEAESGGSFSEEAVELLFNAAVSVGHFLYLQKK